MNLNSQREAIFDTIGCVHLNIKRKGISSEIIFFGKLVSKSSDTVSIILL